MKIDTYRVKQYNSTSKTVVCLDGKPICIVQGCGKTLSNVIAYIPGELRKLLISIGKKVR